MTNRPDFYIPIDYVEALGWATVARQHLEFAIEVLVAGLTKLSGEPPISAGHRFTLERIDYLCRLPSGSPIRLERAVEARSLGRTARRLDEEYHQAVAGILYSRGASNLEWLMRMLNEKAGVPAVPLTMTTRKVDELTLELRTAARRVSDLGARVLDAVDRIEPTSP